MNDAPLNAEWFKRTCERMQRLETVAKAAKAMLEVARRVERGQLGGTHAMCKEADALDKALSELEAQ